DGANVSAIRRAPIQHRYAPPAMVIAVYRCGWAWNATLAPAITSAHMANPPATTPAIVGSALMNADRAAMRITNKLLGPGVMVAIAIRPAPIMRALIGLALHVEASKDRSQHPVQRQAPPALARSARARVQPTSLHQVLRRRCRT